MSKLLYFFSFHCFFTNWEKFLLLFKKWNGVKVSTNIKFKVLKDNHFPYGLKKIIALGLNEIKILKNQTQYFKDQEINENNIQDRKLLNIMNSKFSPTEVCQIRIINSQKEIFESKIMLGTAYSVANENKLRTILNQLVFSARQRGLIIEEVEIAHTHPSAEIMGIDNRNKSFFIFNGLSSQDKKIAQRLATFCQYPVRIKAITEAANYSMIF